MLCCFDNTAHSEPNTYQSQQNWSTYPGDRRYVKTGGNALAMAPPTTHPQNNDYDGGENDLVQVTVPPGVSPGQLIQVAAPDGSGRLVQATVPQGVSAGSNFMVRFPKPVSQSPVVPMQPPVIPMQPPVEAVAVAEPIPVPVPAQAAPATNTVEPVATPVNDYSNVTPVQQPITSTVTPFAQALDTPAPTGTQSYTTPTPAPAPTCPTPPPGQKLMLVRVPPGTAPGTTLHVTVPNEPGRVIAAQVPPGNVQEFHVAYQSLDQQRPQAQGMRPSNNRFGNSNNNSGYRPNRYNQGGMGSMFLPLMGGAALGAAGMSMFDHFGHNGDNSAADANNYGDGGGYGAADAGDYGGADDYGGGGDFGGGGDDFGGGGFDLGGGGFDF